MDMLHLAGIAVTVAAFALLLRQARKEYALLLGLITGVLVFGYILTKAAPVFTEINHLTVQAKIDSKYVSALVKSMGICFVTELAADTCRDAGETAVAGKMEMAGKFAVLLVALPLFSQVAELAVGLLTS